MASRPKGFGMTAELQDKKNAKYDPDLEKEARDWINEVMKEQVLSPSANQDNFHESLKDGVILCQLANKIKPGSVSKFNQSKMAFKMMENISKFLDACASYGMHRTDLFQTVDLFEAQNIPMVIDSIHALGRKVASIDPSLPTLGPKESTSNKREFSEETLKQGENIIGLQMGSNKGASQAGTSFGKPRSIMD